MGEKNKADFIEMKLGNQQPEVIMEEKSAIRKTDFIEKKQENQKPGFIEKKLGKQQPDLEKKKVSQWSGPCSETIALRTSNKILQLYISMTSLNQYRNSPVSISRRRIRRILY